MTLCPIFFYFLMIFTAFSFIPENLKQFRRLQYNKFFSTGVLTDNLAYKKNDCIITITAGTGGADSQDWCSMLVKMYTKFVEKYRNDSVNNDFPKFLSIKSIEKATESGSNGCRSAKIYVTGSNAYNLLMSEKGSHRLVRNSPFNAQNKRMTSFAAVEVSPVLNENDLNVLGLDKYSTLKRSDLKVETMFSEGKGGQNVNKVETAVRITHIPTGISVKCQQERSQERNRAIALKELERKLSVLREDEIKSLEKAVKGPKVVADWGRFIKSYILNPQPRFKDHRINYESVDVQSILNGELLPCILAFHQAKID